MSLPDIQKTEPKFKIALNRVGISGLTLPIFIYERGGAFQHTVANVSCYVDLEADKKGINMSRLPIAIHKYMDIPLKGVLLGNICEHIKKISEAEVCQTIYEFHYFIKKYAPVSKEPGLIDHKVIFNGTKTKDDFQFKFSVESVGTSLCPCSKEISIAGAHNQKCYVTTEVQAVKGQMVWIEDVIDIIDQSVSCEIYSVLKRPDEKFVTERAYNNAKFVEDVARECYHHLSQDGRIEHFQVKVASDESIHMHSAEAIIQSS